MSTPAPRKATRAFGQCCLFYLTMSFHRKVSVSNLSGTLLDLWTASALGCAVKILWHRHSCLCSDLSILLFSASPRLRGESFCFSDYERCRRLRRLRRFCGPLPDSRIAPPIHTYSGVFSSIFCAHFCGQLPFKSLSFNLAIIGNPGDRPISSYPRPLPLCSSRLVPSHPTQSPAESHRQRVATPLAPYPTPSQVTPVWREFEGIQV